MITVVVQGTPDTSQLIVAIDQLGTRRKNEPTVLVAGARYVEWGFGDGSTADGVLYKRDGDSPVHYLLFHHPDGSQAGEVRIVQVDA